ncbi:MAG: MATE family efflux transporter [Oscillospiraceae bacterium]
MNQTKEGFFFKYITSEKNFYKTFFSLAGIIALQNLIAFSVNLCDNLMIGAYSENALSGVALVNQIQFLLQMMITGIGEGMIVLTAQFWGKKDISSIKRTIPIGIKLAFIIGTGMFLTTFFFSDFVLSLLTNDTGVINEGVKYLKIICFSYVLFAITNTLISSLRSVETVKIGFVISFSTLITNICLNSLLIYGNLGFPKLGVEGAAIATLISRIIELIIVIIYTFLVDKKISLKFKDLLINDINLIKQYFKIGFPVFLSNTMWGIAMFAQTAIIGRLGDGAIAANSISTTIFQITSVLGYGAASASAVITGKTIGENKIQKIKKYSKMMQVLYLLIGIATGVTLFFVKDFIISFYSVSNETKALATQFICVMCVAVVGTCYQVASLTGIVRGGGDTKFVLKNDTFFMWLIVLPSAFLSAFVFNFPPIIVFICLKSDQILKCFVAFFKVNYGKWIFNLTK